MVHRPYLTEDASRTRHQAPLRYDLVPAVGVTAANLAVGFRGDILAPVFETCESAGRIDLPHDVAGDEDGARLDVCTGLRLPPDDAWERLKLFT